MIEEFKQFLQHPTNKERRFELINGEIVERGELSMERGLILGNLATALHQYVQQNRLGRAGVSIDYCVPDDPYNYRTIDVSFRSARDPIVTRGCVQGMPDFAAEIKTLDMAVAELREKARYYLANGTRMVWLVLPEQRIIEVYTPDDERILGENDTLSGGDVLPGFSLPVRDVFRDTAIEEN